jgi:hypothetical protein
MPIARGTQTLSWRLDSQATGVLTFAAPRSQAALLKLTKTPTKLYISSRTVRHTPADCDAVLTPRPPLTP